MRIWLVQVGEELPIDPGPPRMWRTCLLAEELALRGHEVTYWSGTFNHQKKTQRHKNNALIEGPNYRYQMLYGRPYSVNISVARILSQFDNARSFRNLVSQQAKPDVILCGYPPIELANEVTKYALRENIPFAIDNRDMWPDIFYERIPAVLHFLATPLFSVWNRMRANAFSHATAITGISDAFVDWGLKFSGRSQEPQDRSFHLAVSSTDEPADLLADAAKQWNAILGPEDPDILTVCFAGTISERMDFETLLDAVQLIPDKLNKRVQFVLCGDGDARSNLLERASKLPNVHLPGWKSGAQLNALLSRADIGLLPYPNTADFQASYPNKVGEYLANGLPILTSLGGITRSLLERENLVFAFKLGDAFSLAAAVEGVLSDLPGLRSRKSRARALYETQFNPQKIYPAFADWIESLSELGAAAK